MFWFSGNKRKSPAHHGILPSPLIKDLFGEPREIMEGYGLAVEKDGAREESEDLILVRADDPHVRVAMPIVNRMETELEGIVFEMEVPVLHELVPAFLGDGDIESDSA